MKQILTLFITLTLLSCSNKETPQQYNSNYSQIADYDPKDTLFRIPKDSFEMGDEFGYVNQKGDTVIPFGKFTQSFSETILTYGIVVEKTGEQHDLIGINQQGQRLYEIYWYDNGPDLISEGMFRILQDGKIGYADTTGRIIIIPQFACASPFSDGKAKAAFDCELAGEGDEHTTVESDSWFYIDKNGNKIKK